MFRYMKGLNQKIMFFAVLQWYLLILKFPDQSFLKEEVSIILKHWLKNHLTTKANLSKIIDKLTGIGLEVEGIRESKNELSLFKFAKV